MNYNFLEQKVISCSNENDYIKQIFREINNREKFQGNFCLNKSSLGIKYWSKFSREAMFIVEQLPSVRVLKMIDEHECITSRSYSLPYIVFSFNFRGFEKTPAVNVYCNRKPLSSSNDLLYECFLPNVGVNGSICMATPPQYGSYEEYIEWFLDIFWSSSFNKELLNNYLWLAHADPKHFGYFEKWSKWSEKDPSYALKAPYKPYSHVSPIIKMWYLRIVQNMIACIRIFAWQEQKSVRKYVEDFVESCITYSDISKMFNKV